MNNIQRYANSEMVIKTIVMFSIYLVPYVLIVTSAVTNTWALFGLLFCMSIGTAGIGLSVMHDANHGAYSRQSWINTFIGYSLNLVGASSFTWKIQHNVLHHTFTNVHEEDEDINSRGLLRLTPHTPWKWIHKYQHIYSWFFYGMMTIVWLFFKDYVRIVRYQRNGLASKQKANMLNEWIVLLATKLVYIGYMFVIPALFTPFAWWQVIIAVVVMHYGAGFLLAIIFQPAHVIEGSEFPLPDHTGNTLETNWAVHQLMTTTNFGNRSRWFSWYVGGLNFQIEHHLFPNICHVHYRSIQPIVRKTAEEFGLPYRSTTTFLEAVIKHGKLLKQLGRKPQLALALNGN